MKGNIGITEKGTFNEDELVMDCAAIQHSEWCKRGYGAKNPSCNVPFEELSSEERMKNYFSVKAIIEALKEANLLVRKV